MMNMTAFRWDGSTVTVMRWNGSSRGGADVLVIMVTIPAVRWDGSAQGADILVVIDNYNWYEIGRLDSVC